MGRYSERVAAAIEFARELHAGQKRKGTEEPYFNHLVGTMEIAVEHGANEVEMVAAVLHDAYEDHPRGGATAREVTEKFGAKVNAVVQCCTNVFGSKMAYAAHLALMPKSVALVAASDKLYNARSIVAAHAEVGEVVFSRFKAPKAEVVAYYRAVAEALKESAPHALAAELSAEVAKMESF